MLYYFFEKFFQDISMFRVFGYITIRAMLAFIISFFIVLIIGKPFINFLKNKKIGEEIRKLGPETHYDKKGTPTMGGVLILISVIVTILIAGNFTNKFNNFLLFSIIAFGLLGFIDDYIKWNGKTKDGLSARKKLIVQSLLGASVCVFLMFFPLSDASLSFSLVNPFIKSSYIYLGAIIYFFIITLVIVGTSNAVNITDGLDGLVIMPVIIVATVLGVIAYLTGHVELSSYLNLYYISGSGEILVFLATIVGAGLGFLWYNSYPAQIFMGDTGSLSLGGVIGISAVFLKQELLLPIIGGIFVIEALSVIIQVSSYKLRKKRVFKMAPIHHHFEILGIPETKISVRVWILALMFGMLGLLILKIR